MTDAYRARLEAYHARKAKVMSLRAQGLTLQEIGERLGLTKQSVHRIVHHAYGTRAPGVQIRKRRTGAAIRAAQRQGLE